MILPPADRFFLLAAVAAALVAAGALLLPPALRITHYDIIGAQIDGPRRGALGRPHTR